jgi:hypothetical protein
MTIQPLLLPAGGAAPHAQGGQVRHPSYIMPRDFDLSANFEILKLQPR